MKREMTVHYRNVEYKRKNKQKPQIVICGDWLEKIGFSIGNKIEVDCNDGKLVITKKVS